MADVDLANKASEYMQALLKHYILSHAANKDNSSDFIIFRQEGNNDDIISQENINVKRYTDFLFILGGFFTCLVLWIGRFLYRKFKTSSCGGDSIVGKKIRVGPYGNDTVEEEMPFHPKELSEENEELPPNKKIANRVYHDVALQIKEGMIERANVLAKKISNDATKDGKELFELNKKQQQVVVDIEPPPPPPPASPTLNNNH